MSAGKKGRNERGSEKNTENVIDSYKETLQNIDTLQKKETLEKKKTIDENKGQSQNNMIERETNQKEIVMQRVTPIQEEVHNFQKDVDINNKRNIRMKNTLQKKNDVLKNDMIMQKERESIQKDYDLQIGNDSLHKEKEQEIDVVQTENEALPREKEQDAQNIVIVNDDQLSKSESMMHLPHEPVCHIKEEPLEDPIEDYMSSNDGHMHW